MGKRYEGRGTELSYYFQVFHPSSTPPYYLFLNFSEKKKTNEALSCWWFIMLVVLNKAWPIGIELNLHLLSMP